ncbi:ergothioneine biosynthesis protein EgtC [Aeromicrobium sp.]|uniref:ergothioneine biosynthesis protein EgtC n=1 Tax=Aeromicrobium sp. TaxID=1871063 RepID=UPI0030BA975D
MCRHLAYLGPPVTLAEMVLLGPHSLLHQSWAPREMRGGGTINADGFGVGWIDTETGGAARRYRREIPIWSDASLPDLAASVSSGAILAAVRSATVGMPVTHTACAPFVEGPWMFSHNGVVAGWPASVAVLADDLLAVDLMTLCAPTDSAFLWALVRQRLGEGQSAARALAGVADEVLALAPGSRLNLLLNDGVTIAATTAGHALWYRQGDRSVTVSSEPIDPDQEGWQPVPELSLLEATASQCSIQSLDNPATKDGHERAKS